MSLLFVWTLKRHTKHQTLKRHTKAAEHSTANTFKVRLDGALRNLVCLKIYQGFGLDDFHKVLPTQTILCFCKCNFYKITLHDCIYLSIDVPLFRNITSVVQMERALEH